MTCRSSCVPIAIALFCLSAGPALAADPPATPAAPRPAAMEVPAAGGTALVPELELLRPFVGKTWKGLLNAEKKQYDVSRWEVVLRGRAVRLLHSVGDGVYGGESLIHWDPVAKEVVYDYVTTAAFTTRGTMASSGPGKVEVREVVRGEAGGVTEVRATTEILPDGRMKVSTRMLRNGEWKENPPRIYEEDPAAKVVLP